MLRCRRACSVDPPKAGNRGMTRTSTTYNFGTYVFVLYTLTDNRNVWGTSPNNQLQGQKTAWSIHRLQKLVTELFVPYIDTLEEICTNLKQ